MASTIAAGTTSGTAIAIAGDTSGVLQLQTNGTTAAVTIDTNQRAAFVAGTDALPAITTTGDTNTGIFFPAADTIAFSEGGTESMRIDSSGNVGIGATSPSGKLDVRGASYFGAPNTFIIGDDGGSTGAFLNETASLPMRFLTSGTERMRIASDGTLQVKSSTATAPWDATSGNYVWVGGTYPVGGANSDIIAIFNRHTNNGTVVEIKKGTSLLGTISHNGTNTAYNTSSDYRLKENIAPMAGALQTVSLLKPCTYTWKSDGSKGQGFIAHELQECLPDAVTGEKDAVETYTDKNGNEQTKIKPQQIDTSFLVATLTAAIQELNAKVDAQAVRIAELEGAK